MSGVELWIAEKIRFGQGQDDTVQIGERLKGFGQFVTQQIGKGFAQQIEFAVGIHKAGDLFQELGPHGNFPVPIVDRTF